MPLITLSRFDQGSLGHVACFWEGNGGKLQLASERQATSSKDSELFLIITGSNGLAPMDWLSGVVAVEKHSSISMHTLLTAPYSIDALQTDPSAEPALTDFI